VHLLSDDLVMHVMVSLDVLQELVRAVGAHVNQFLGPSDCAVSELCLLVCDVPLAQLVTAGTDVPLPSRMVTQIIAISHGSGWPSSRIGSPPSVLNWSPVTTSALPDVR
jgi:hypothetical protein